MKPYRATRRPLVLAGLLVVLVVAACAPMTHAVRQPGDVAPAQGDPFDVVQARQVFWQGYGNIADRYIDPVDLALVTAEGLKGLTAIDPALSFSIDGEHGVLVVSMDGRELAAFALTGEDDAQGWADVTVASVLLARANSQALRATTQEAVYKAVFDGGLATLDVFSRYDTAAQAHENRASRNGFGGIGLRYALTDGRLAVTEVFPGTPAERAGLVRGDAITHVDGDPLSGLTSADIRDRLRGPIDSMVILTVRKKAGGEQVNVAVTRELVIPSTVSVRVDHGLARIAISSFNQQTSATLAQALDDAGADEGRLRGVVLDLRDNPGGLLDQAVAVSDLFLARGGIVHTRGRHPDAGQHYDATAGDVGETVPVVVLIDGQSASAAEIVAAALQDNGRGPVVGTTSFGKGSVQTVVRLPNDGELMLTWSRFHAPSGYALHGLGVLPNLCTAGAEAPTDISRKLDELRTAATSTAADIEQWRSIRPDDVQAHQRLRRICPPGRHQDGDLDLLVARRMLLEDPTLLARAIALTQARAAQR